MEISPEAAQTILQVIGTPTGMGLVLYYLWHYGPGKDFNRLVDDFTTLRQKVDDEMAVLSDARDQNEKRIQRLEIITEHILSNEANFKEFKS